MRLKYERKSRGIHSEVVWGKVRKRSSPPKAGGRRGTPYSLKAESSIRPEDKKKASLYSKKLIWLGLEKQEEVY